MVAVDQSGRPKPFQELMHRFRRTSDVRETIERIPVRLYLFDLLYLDGRSVIDLPQDDRRKLLEEVCPPELLAPRPVTASVEQAKIFFEKSLQEGPEGLVAKALEGRYALGARGKEWLKIKRTETLDSVIVAADWGSGRRHRWLSNYHLAVRNVNAERFSGSWKDLQGTYRRRIRTDDHLAPEP